MDGHFLSYLILILILISVLTGLIMLLVVKLRKRKAMSKAAQAINAGNVSVFFDKGNNVTIIPYAKDKFGIGRAVGMPLILKWPFNADELGAGVRYSMKTCSEGKPCSNNELMAVLKYTGWKEFSVGKRNISVHYHEGNGVVMNTTTRRIDGSYQFNQFGFEKVVSPDISDKQLGEILLQLLGRCKA